MSNQIEKVYKNTLILLEDRKYKINPQYYLSKQYYVDDIIIKNKDKLLVYIVTDIDSSVNLKHIRIIVKFANKIKTKRLIIIGKNIKIDVRIRSYLKTLPMIVDLIKYELLIINPLRHILVPPQRLLDKKEKNLIFKNSNIKKEHLPKIYESDPIITWLGGKVGDVIEVKRNIGKLMTASSLQQLVYRIVINPKLVKDGLIDEHNLEF